jgi:hypothetical protein
MFSFCKVLARLAPVFHNTLQSVPTNILDPPSFEPLPSYSEATQAIQIEVTIDRQISVLNAYDFGDFTPPLGLREEENNEIFYDATEPNLIFLFIRNR